uniref:Uncharacterized protein n=1 Tax=biofilter metagenome TaxID=1070537 RepID=A0A193SD20_9ZZZZ
MCCSVRYRCGRLQRSALTASSVNDASTSSTGITDSTRPALPARRANADCLGYPKAPRSRCTDHRAQFSNRSFTQSILAIHRPYLLFVTVADLYDRQSCPP